MIFFIGSGAHLVRAVRFAQGQDYPVAGVCCLMNDTVIGAIERLGVPLLTCEHPNVALPGYLSGSSVTKVFSINNPTFLTDEVLTSGPTFFNIHNGLVQEYRGYAEICHIAALKNGSSQYGVTLHKLSAGQKVDSGAVVDQVTFEVPSERSFESLMKISFRACEEVFKKNLKPIVDRNIKLRTIDPSPKSWGYNDINGILSGMSLQDARLLCDLGVFGGAFPRLKKLLDEELARLIIDEGEEGNVG